MGVFDSNPAVLNQWALYDAELQFHAKVMGGIPRDPQIIEGWLRSRAGIADAEELRQALLRTAYENGLDVSAGTTYEQLVELTSKIAQSKQTQGFKRDVEGGLYIENRQVKAALREAVSILFPYATDKWGATKKAPRSYAAERVFVYPRELFLGVHEPSGVELLVGHVTGPQGPRSTLGYVEYVTAPTVTFQVLSLEDGITESQWARIWDLSQHEGIGAKRSYGAGTFEVTRWDRLGHPTADQLAAIHAADREHLVDRPLPSR